MKIQILTAILAASLIGCDAPRDSSKVPWPGDKGREIERGKNPDQPDAPTPSPEPEPSIDHEGEYYFEMTTLNGECDAEGMFRMVVVHDDLTDTGDIRTGISITGEINGGEMHGVIDLAEAFQAIISGTVGDGAMSGDWYATDQDCDGIFTGELI